ncbi:MAG TPA: XrtA system polysaccharide chain length determinant [Gammaproteobacteria bacterium]|nr:XrtA system polysaccharide chain length determinant [Gammaproteobacteria bacterium]
MQSETEQNLRVLSREAFTRRKTFVIAFIAISVASVLMGLSWPKRYTSSTTILVEGRSIIEPLMSGTAVRGDVIDRTRNAREIIYGRPMLIKVLEAGGWLKDDVSPRELEMLIEEMQAKTTVAQLGENLIRIEFTGSDPQKVYETTGNMAEIFIQEAMTARAKESNAAFVFIDEQVRQYENTLAASEERINALRQKHPELSPGAEEESARRIAEIRSSLDRIEQEIREAEIRRESLTEQLSGEVEGAVAAGRAREYRTRISELQSQLDTLRLTYHDTYPDIIQLRHQIQELERVAVSEEAKLQEERRQARAEGRTHIDQSFRSSPVYQDLQAQVYDVNTMLRTLRARLADAHTRLEHELTVATRIQEIAADFQALTRDHEVNRTIYQDLLRRRENARVSMNLNTEQQGLNLRIVEPAYLSYQPTSLRLTHFAAGGVVLGAALPLGLLFGFLLVDPRIRTGAGINDRLGLPLLAIVPHLDKPREAAAERRGLILSGVVIVLTVAGILVVLVLRMQGVI